MIVKVPQQADHIKNLAEAFSLLRKYNMTLNSSKCIFEDSSSRFWDSHPKRQQGTSESNQGHTQHEVTCNDKKDTKSNEQSSSSQLIPLDIY
ncbi:hypothetical protein L3X38_024228 [Prunus dulcis]|uniref:Uncharacterized protein n=1 Tax=Prunus dulcis TaxID=3755 RepID=A0AAD4VZD5_PRUDU|nr:hypothetical protein L3X38_024228 [Prunus dulcis]